MKLQVMRERMGMYLLVAVASLTLVACEPMVDRRGHIQDEKMKDAIIVGSTTKDEVMRQFGSPSSISSFGDETWYYIQARKQATAFLRPETTDQNVVQVVFDDAGTAKEVKSYNLDDKKEVVLVEQITPTEGHSLGFFEQVLGNLGRFNKPREMAPPGRR